MNGLRISGDFYLPYEFITQTLAILAKRGVGKTYTAAVIVEEIIKAALRAVVVDPLGVWWGLRASADGKHEGLPIVVIGGEHGDLPLTEDMGAVLAEFVVSSNTSFVLDLSLLRKAAQVRFMTAFCEALYHQNRNPLHLVFDEADLFAPQKPFKGQERMLGAMEDIVRRGRARGLGITLITQRAAVLNKDVLTQIEVLAALRTVSPQDRAAVDAWINVHGTPEQRTELMTSLPSLPVGTAWFWSPGWLDVFQRVQVRKRETFDSSATPKIGQQIAAPDKIAPVDLEALREQLAESIKKAEETDPKKLQEKIVKLQRELQAKPKVEVQRVEVPVIADEQMAELKALAKSMIDQAQALLSFGQEIMTLIGQAQPTPAKYTQGQAPTPNAVSTHRAVEIPARPVVAAELSGVPDESENENRKLKAGAIRMLTAVAQRHPMALTRQQLATLSGFKLTGGTFGTYFGDLKRAGLLTEENGKVTATEDGIALAGVQPTMPETTGELMAMWRSAFKKAGIYRMLEVLVECYPEWLTRAELSEITGFALSGGTFGTYLGALRQNGLIEENGKDVRAADALFLMEGAR